jgi:cytochrome c553
MLFARQHPHLAPPAWVVSTMRQTLGLLFPHIRALTRTALFALGVLGTWESAVANDRAGEQIYRQRCASCHGATGEGTDDNYPHPLAGEKTLPQLARFIAKSMPKDSKDKCSPAEAGKVAGYIYEAFYSRDARERSKPPRVELARLTVRQYRNAIADLIGSFREPPPALVPGKAEQGLHGEYFKSRRFRNNEKLLERTDPTIRFDFGESGPNDKFDPNQFSIRWEGSVLAPETGEYDFVVRTDHAARFWLNDLKRPLIDALVRSGNDTEYRASLTLLGGRVYPLRLEFSKAKQGVDDSKDKKKKPKPVRASVALEWKPPGRAAEAIPQMSLFTNRFPQAYVVTTPFPPDDRSMGYERGTSISKAWDRATTDAAIEVADYVATHLADLSGTPDDAPDRNSRMRDFCRRFAERAFRRALSPEQQRLFVDHPFDHAGELEMNVKRAILLILKSPRFLYREIGSGNDGFDVASRISFGLWDALPDRELLKAAAAGKLATREEVLHQTERMLNDLRTRAKLREFFFGWLKLDPAPDLSKDPKRFPGFDASIASDLRVSLDLLLQDVIWSDESDFRQLLLSDHLYLNGRLGKFYGYDLPADASFQKVRLNTQERAGVLSHPYLMAAFSYAATSSPIHRGVFLARNVLGQALRPPPDAFVPLPADLHPSLTTRERVALQTRPDACQSCHSMINPLGFTMEHFDAVGRYQEKEREKPIDASGAYLTRSGQRVSFNGVRDLATFLAGSEETQEAFIERLFHNLVKQPVRAFGPQKLSELRRLFADKQYNVRKLTVDIITESAMIGKESP